MSRNFVKTHTLAGHNNYEYRDTVTNARSIDIQINSHRTSLIDIKHEQEGEGDNIKHFASVKAFCPQCQMWFLGRKKITGNVFVGHPDDLHDVTWKTAILEGESVAVTTACEGS